MNNLNLDLIEKVKSGKAAIEHTRNKEDSAKLQLLIKEIFPNDINTVPQGHMQHYYASQINKGMWSSMHPHPKHLETIPLAAFFTNSLPAQDLSLIEQIDKRLKQAEKLIFEAKEEFYLRYPNDEPIVEPKEVRYVWCKRWQGGSCTVGKVYQISQDDENTIICDNGLKVWYKQNGEFPPATEADFNQQKEVEQERWNISVQPFKHNPNDHRVVIYYQDGILSSVEAYKLQEEIKQYLSKK